MPYSRFVVISFLTLLLISVLLIAQLFWALITPIVLALVLVSIFTPLNRFMLRICRNHRYSAASLTTLIIILSVSIPLSLFVGALAQQSLEYYETANARYLFSGIFGQVSHDHPIVTKILEVARFFGIEISTEKVLEDMSEFFKAFGLVVYDALTRIASNAAQILFNSLITFVVVFTLFVSGSSLKTYLMELAPLPHDEQERLIAQFSEISQAVFVGNGVIALLEGLLGGLTIYIFGIGPGIFLGFLIAIAAFLPVVGASIVVVPASLFLFFDGQITQGILYLAVNSVFLSVLEFYLKPRLIGTKSRMHAVLVLLSILAGIQIFGVLGLFYGPLVVTMFMSLAEIYKEHYREHLLRAQDSLKVETSL